MGAYKTGYGYGVFRSPVADALRHIYFRTFQYLHRILQTTRNGGFDTTRNMCSPLAVPNDLTMQISWV